MLCFNKECKSKKAFVSNRKKPFVCAFFAIFIFALLAGFKVNTAHASVCFLPDPSMCDDAEGRLPDTGIYGERDDGGLDICASYVFEFAADAEPLNRCGEYCERCNDESSPNFGLYKCPEETCGWCDIDGGYTSNRTKNKCGDDCERCTDKHSQSYGKYKCPEDNCDDCAGYDLTRAQVDFQKCNWESCTACPYDSNRFKCDDCNNCVGYDVRGDDIRVLSGAYDCEKCPSGDWYSCQAKDLCGDNYDDANNLTTSALPSGFRHINCIQCTQTGNYDAHYGRYFCQDDGCMGYDTHENELGAQLEEYACCQCEPNYRDHTPLVAENFRLDNGNWYKECEEFCKASEDNFFNEHRLRSEYDCYTVGRDNLPDSYELVDKTISLSCGNKTHQCYHPIVSCPADTYKYSAQESAERANDPHYQTDPCEKCGDENSCFSDLYKCSEDIEGDPDYGCPKDEYLYVKSDFDYEYNGCTYIPVDKVMSGLDYTTCNTCLAGGRPESERLYSATGCQPNNTGNYKDQTTYERDFANQYGYSIDICEDYLYETEGCQPILTRVGGRRVWYYNYNENCIRNRCSGDRIDYNYLNQHSSELYNDSGSGWYGYQFESPDCYCRYLNWYYYDFGNDQCYDACSQCSTDEPYDSSYNGVAGYNCQIRCTDCSGNEHYDCECQNGYTMINGECVSDLCDGDYAPITSSNCGAGYDYEDGGTTDAGTQCGKCVVKECPTGQVTRGNCSGEFTQSGAMSGEEECGYCCESGTHWDGSECAPNACEQGILKNECDTSKGYVFTGNGQIIDGVECGECECPTGTTESAGQCVENGCPYYASQQEDDCGDGYDFTQVTSYEDTNGNTVLCGTCDPKSCPAGEVTSSNCSGEFTPSGAMSGSEQCGHCCAAGTHWDGSECAPNACTEGKLKDECPEYLKAYFVANGYYVGSAPCGTCVCPADRTDTGSECKCPDGTTDVGGICKNDTCADGFEKGLTSCPATYNYIAGNDTEAGSKCGKCECPTGTTEVGGECVVNACPTGVLESACTNTQVFFPNGSYDGNNNPCGECKDDVCETNFTKNLTKDSCECSTKFVAGNNTAAGSTCGKCEKCPSGTYSYAHSTECLSPDSGYTVAADQCSQVQNGCNYQYVRAANTDIMPTGGSPSGFCNSAATTCSSNTCTRGSGCNIFDLASVYVSGGTPYVYAYNKIDKTSQTCKKTGGGVDYYEKICSGTPKSLCANGTFVSNGCESETYYAFGGNQYQIMGDEFGTCTATPTTCESQGMYSTLDACQNKNDMNLGSCSPYSSCYKYTADKISFRCNFASGNNSPTGYNHFKTAALDNGTVITECPSNGSKIYVPAGTYKVIWAGQNFYSSGQGYYQPFAGVLNGFLEGSGAQSHYCSDNCARYGFSSCSNQINTNGEYTGYCTYTLKAGQDYVAEIYYELY